MEQKHLTVGILAHVDAGKTTLAESILYHSGKIRKAGRVDHGDSFLDNYALERMRGITIFSKQAEVLVGDKEVTLLDTPGHVDFSAEMERTLQVLDYAILVIGGMDGVQGHVRTLWKLLEVYKIPTFLFINKMDQPGADKTWILKELQKRLSANCVDFSDTTEEQFCEQVAECDDELLEKYFNGENIEVDDLQRVIRERKLFPCFFGSALKGQGVERFMTSMSKWTSEADCSNEFGAKVFKISRDEQGNRLTHMKITGGSLKVKAQLSGEKVNQIRIYSGAGFQPVSEAYAGQVCAVTGLTKTYSGQ